MQTIEFRNRLLARVTVPAAEPLSVPETKTYLRVDDDTQDGLIGDLIVAARMNAESWMRRSLITQSWMLGYDDCLPERVNLPMGPVDSITSVVTIARDGGTDTVSSSLYALNSAKNQLIMDVPIRGFHVEVSYNAGYGADASDVPAPIRQGLLCHVAALYENRGQDGEYVIPGQVYALYAPYREVLL